MIRHAHSLKDKRNIIKSLVQRLKNRGFTVTECNDAESPENPKFATVGFAYVGSTKGAVDKALDDGFRLFVGDYEVVGQDRELTDFSGDDMPEVSEDEDLKYGL